MHFIQLALMEISGCIIISCHLHGAGPPFWAGPLFRVLRQIRLGWRDYICSDRTMGDSLLLPPAPPPFGGGSGCDHAAALA